VVGVDPDEVHDHVLLAEGAVDGVAQGAGHDQAQGEGLELVVPGQLPHEAEDHAHGDDGEDAEDGQPDGGRQVAEQPDGGPGVLGVHEGQEAGDDLDGLAQVADVVHHHLLGDLVGHDEQQAHHHEDDHLRGLELFGDRELLFEHGGLHSVGAA